MSDDQEEWREFTDGVVLVRELWLGGCRVATFRRLLKPVVLSEGEAAELVGDA